MDKTNCYFYYNGDKSGPSGCSHSTNWDWPVEKELPCNDCIFYITKEKANKVIESLVNVEPTQIGYCNDCIHYKLCTKAKAGSICRIKYPEE